MSRESSAVVATKTPETVDDADESAVPRSIARVLDVFEAVLAEHPCTLTQAATATDLTPTTTLRYLRALETRGYIDRNDQGDFSAGPTILRIAASLGSGTALDRLAAITQPHLDALATLTGESTYLAISDGQTGTYIATAESPRAIRHVGWVGQHVELDGSALGAALAAPGETAVRTGAIEPDITAMSLAVPTGQKVGVAISIVGPEHRFTPDRQDDHAQALAAAVDALAQELHSNKEDLTS